MSVHSLHFCSFTQWLQTSEPYSLCFSNRLLGISLRAGTMAFDRSWLNRHSWFPLFPGTMAGHRRGSFLCYLSSACQSPNPHMALCFLMSLQNKSYSVKLQDLKKIMWQIIILSIWPEGFLQSIVCDFIWFSQNMWSRQSEHHLYFTGKKSSERPSFAQVLTASTELKPQTRSFAPGSGPNRAFLQTGSEWRARTATRLLKKLSPDGHSGSIWRLSGVELSLCFMGCFKSLFEYPQLIASSSVHRMEIYLQEYPSVILVMSSVHSFIHSLSNCWVSLCQTDTDVGVMVINKTIPALNELIVWRGRPNVNRYLQHKMTRNV